MTNYIREGLKTLPGHWHQGGWRNGAGDQCGGGHVRSVIAKEFGEHTEFFRSMDLVFKIMGEVAYEQFPERAEVASFFRFNDHPDTTEAEVIAVMEKAALLLDETL